MDFSSQPVPGHSLIAMWLVANEFLEGRRNVVQTLAAQSGSEDFLHLVESGHSLRRDAQ
jgi:hypothetical protein